MTAAGAPEGNRPDLVDQFLRRLAQAQAQKLTGIETTTQMAELLWLATRLEAPPPEPPREPPEERKDPGDTVGQSRPQPPAESRPQPWKPPPAQKVDVVARSPQKALPAKVLPVQVVDPAMLADPLEVIKSLKPLFQKREAGTGSRLDEPQTVDFIARTDLCVPKLQPDREAWFDIVLVIDRSSASMIIWQRLVEDIVRTLKRYGAFRDVRVFDLVIYPDAQPDKNEEPVMLRSRPNRPEHHPKELIDQQGRRLAIILSDTTAAHWWRGTVTPMVQDWGHHMPVVLWHMLPPWLWQRTALGRGTSVSIRNELPGVANQRWKTRAPNSGAQAKRQRQVAIPVVTSETYDLTRWSQLIVGKPVVAPGFILSREGDVPRSMSMAADLADLDEANIRVNRFLRLASPEAQWLLMLLAAAPVITLPIVRLIREAKLPKVTSPLPIAEIFTSGLLKRLAEPEKPPSKTPEEPNPVQSEALVEPQNLVQYDFVGQVREALLSGKWLPPVEAVEVINSVSRAIEKRFNRLYPHTFQAYLKDPNIDLPEGLEGLKAFATITADILEKLGAPYADLVRQLRHGANKTPIPAHELDPYGKHLQRFTYEVAEYLDFPAVEPFDFFYGQFRTFPPVLEPDEFTILTVELPTPTADQSLEPFDITVATLTRSDESQDWEIQREQQQAYRYIEQLPNDETLEMVAIPGGTFQMGSPEDEPHRSDWESPQHEVTVEPFFMGRYPVTQAQWRVVAILPKVERDLNPDPSTFKGDNRPVETVSWYHAVEFCARLSAHTGREYRLPTEAEWEYACRAGTTTPFHFGETISSEVANYDGNITYADGPQGERRGETTPVDYFEVANAFGLSDMHGNVREWCQDHWHRNYDGAPTDGSAWLTENEAANRVRRGGSWGNSPRFCRSAYRSYDGPGYRSNDIGFRVCCSAPRTL